METQTNDIIEQFQSRITSLPIDDFIEYELNNKEHTQQQIELLKTNIEKFGFTVPIIIDENNTIVAGHGRYLASRELGIKILPALRITDLSENEIKEYRLLDNRVTDLGIRDLNNLSLELSEIQSDSLNSMFINFNLPNFDDVDTDELDIDTTYDEVASQEAGGYQESIKKIELYFNSANFVELLDIFEKLMEEGKVDNLSDLIINKINVLYSIQEQG